MTTSEVKPPITQPAKGPHDSDPRTWPHQRWITAGAFTGLGLVLFLCYLAEARKLPIFADGASQALQAWDMLHGNLLLHGWVLSDVSFYTTELPQYMLIELVRGLNPDVVHIAGAMTYALLVVLAAVLAKGKATGREALARVLIPVGIMLAPPLGSILTSRADSTAWIMLSAPDHTGTQIPLVLTWLVLDRLRPRWWVPVTVAVMLTWVQIADPTALYEGALPIVAVCLVRMYRRRGPLAGQWYDLSLAVGAIASAGVATAALALIKSHGGFIVNPAPPSLVTVSGMTNLFWVKVRGILSLFGADFFGLTGTHAVVPVVHLVAVALVAWAVVRAARRFFADDDLAMQVVTASFVILLAAFMLGTKTGGREAVGLLPMGAVLAGRMLPTRVFQLRLVPALAAVLACYGLLLGAEVVGPAAPSPDRPLASWLAARHLTYGLSESWYASNGVTVYSRDHVRVRDVQVSASGGLARLRWNTEASWYNPGKHDARFLILNPCPQPPAGHLIRISGPRPATYFVDGFTVLVWHANLLASTPTGTQGRARFANPESATFQVMCG